jgi:hypothetical protein
VVLSFPELSLRETLLKLFRFADIAVLLLLAWGWLFGWRHGLKLEPARFALALVGLTLGIGASAVLLGYLPTAGAIWLGAIVATALGVFALGRAYTLPVTLSSLAPLVFLSGGNAGLLLLLMGLVVLGSLLPTESFEQLFKGLKR